jgi:hypothetical protein
MPQVKRMTVKNEIAHFPHELGILDPKKDRCGGAIKSQSSWEGMIYQRLARFINAESGLLDHGKEG